MPEMLSTAIQIAREAGALLRQNFGGPLEINHAETHDIKLQLDVECQRLIESRLRAAFPEDSIVGEEESHGDPEAGRRWIVDPLDGTVNFTYQIPHYAVSIARQQRQKVTLPGDPLEGYASDLAVIYDPSRDELFTAERGKGAFLNGRPMRVSARRKMEEAILSVGFSKTPGAIEKGLESYQQLIRRARKIRTMGSAALDLAYVAAGRMEAYMEFKVRLWDIAAGILLVEEAGGRVELRRFLGGEPHTFLALVSNDAVDLRALFEKGCSDLTSC